MFHQHTHVERRTRINNFTQGPLFKPLWFLSRYLKEVQLKFKKTKNNASPVGLILYEQIHI